MSFLSMLYGGSMSPFLSRSVQRGAVKVKVKKSSA